MASMMVMGWRRGLVGAGIEDSIGRDLGMVMECIGFIQEMCMLGSGVMGRAMGVVFILVRTGAGMWVNLNGVLNMALDITILGNIIIVFFIIDHSYRLIICLISAFRCLSLKFEHTQLLFSFPVF